MPSTLTPGTVPNTSAAVTAALACTAPSAGDNRTAATVATPLQQLLNVIAVIGKLFSGATLGGVSDQFTHGGTVSGHNVSASNLVSCGGNYSGAGDISCGGDVTCNDVNASGNLVCAGSITGAVNGTFSGTLAAANMGATLGTFGTMAATAVDGKRINHKVIGANADTTYELKDYDLVSIPNSSTLSTDRSYTIATTSAADGMSIRFQNYDTGRLLHILGIPLFPGPTGYTLKNVASGDSTGIEVTRMGGALYITATENKH
jgi:hypothetical protein